MKTQRKILMTLILIIAAALLLTASAFAKQTFDLSEIYSDITVTGSADGSHTVSYGGVDYPVSAGKEVEFIGTGEHSITLDGVYASTAKTKITLNNVEITCNKAPIYIDAKAHAVITIRGENTLTNSQADSNDGIITFEYEHMLFDLMGDLTIDGDGKLTLVGDTNGAKIGSSASYNMFGELHITDNVKIITNDIGNADGACIGSGNGKSFAGTVKIDGNAKVEAYSNYDGAGIGSGCYGDFTVTGKVIIAGNANVIAINYEDGAGIGSGENGDFKGNVIIGGNAVVYALSGDDGAGIGSGEDGDFTVTGKVIIEENANVTAISDDEGTGIGSSWYGDFEGDIIIGGSATVYAESKEEGAGIGSGEHGAFTGKVTIGGNVDVTAIGGMNYGAGIGSSYQGDFTGQVIIGENATIYAEGRDNSAGIGAGEDCADFTGTITIKDSANVTAIGQGDAPAVGAAGNAPMDGTTTIKDFAVVTVCAGDECEGCIIGANGDDSADSTGTIEILGNAQILRHEDHPEDFALIGAPIGSFKGNIIVGNFTTIFGRDGRYVNRFCYVDRNEGRIVIVKYYAPPPPAPAPAEPAKYEIKLDPNRGETTAEKLITDENGKVANFPEAQRKGYVFMGWYDALTGGKKVDGNTVFTKNTTIYAMWKMDIDGDTFAQKKAETTRYLISAINASSNKFTVEVKSSDGGWINPKETRIINYGGNLTVSAFPDPGKKVVSFIVDGKDKGSINTYTFKNIRENHKVEVVFG